MKKLVAIDVETSSLDFDCKIASVQVYYPEEDFGEFFPINMCGIDAQTTLESLEAVKEILLNSRLVGFKLMFDLLQLRKLFPDIIPEVAGDGYILALMVQKINTLGNLAVNLGIAPASQVRKLEDFAPDCDCTEISWDDQAFITHYAMKDSEWGYLVEKRLLEKYPSYLQVYQEEVSNLNMFVNMQYQGMRFQSKEFYKFRDRFNNHLAKKRSQFDDEIGFEFNPRSRKNMEQVFDLFNLESPIKTDKGKSSYSEEALNYFKHIPAIEKIITLKSKISQQATLANFEKYVYDSQGKDFLHPEYRPVGTDGTSRVYTSQPSSNSLPKAIRKFVIPDNDDFMFVYSDWSAAELILAAYWAGEQWIIDLQEKGIDLHTYIASKLLHISFEEAKNQRETSKTVLFSIFYGSRGAATARALKIPIEEGIRLVDEFKLMIPNIMKMFDGFIKTALKTGYTRTIIGRRRYLSKLYSPDLFEVESATRQVINSAVQGSVADLQKILLRIFFSKFGLGSTRIVTTVFDSFLIQVKKDVDRGKVVNFINKYSDFDIGGIQVKFHSKIKFGSNYYDVSV